MLRTWPRKPGKHPYQTAALTCKGLLPPLPPQSGPSNYPQDEPEDVEVEEQEVGPGFCLLQDLFFQKVTYIIYVYIYICVCVLFWGRWLLLIWDDVFLFVPFFGYDDVIVRGNSDFRDIDERVHCTLLTQKQGEIFLFVLQQVSKDQCLGGLWNHAESVMYASTCSCGRSNGFQERSVLLKYGHLPLLQSRSLT